MTNLVTILSTKIGLELSKNIANLYHSIQKSFQLHDYKKVANEVGLFCDGILMALWILYDNTRFPITGVNFDNKCRALMNMEKYEPDSSLTNDENDNNIISDESIRIYIPRALLSIYTLRSKRQVAHLRGLEIDYLDTLMIVQSSSWVLSEILSIISGIPDNETMEILQNVGRMHLPIVEWIHDELVLGKETICMDQAILVIIAVSGGSMGHTAAIKILRQNYPNASDRSIYSARDDAITKEWIHRTQSNILSLRAKGWNEAKRIASILS